MLPVKTTMFVHRRQPRIFLTLQKKTMIEEETKLTSFLMGLSLFHRICNFSVKLNYIYESLVPILVLNHLESHSICAV